MPEFDTRPKIMSWKTASRRVREVQAQGQRVVFTNGCFDLLHAGHVRYLEAARGLGELLIVGLNADDSVRRLAKGPGRPFIPEGDRAEILAALACVDGVVLFHEDTPLELIDVLRPDILVKGGDYTLDRIVGRDAVQSWGGEVQVIPVIPGRSTSQLIAAIRAAEKVTMDKRDKLLHLLKRKSYRYREHPPFKLVSGRESPYYIDCKPTTHNAEGMALIGEIFFDRLRDLEVAAIGGLTMGADPIAHATAVISYQKGKPINSFSVRKSPKSHGLGKLIEGEVRPGDRVVIVEDVVTTGSSTIQAINAAREFGLKVIKVIALVDREEGGKQEIEKYVPKVEAIYTLAEITDS